MVRRNASRCCGNCFPAFTAFRYVGVIGARRLTVIPSLWLRRNFSSRCRLFDYSRRCVRIGIGIYGSRVVVPHVPSQPPPTHATKMVAMIPTTSTPARIVVDMKGVNVTVPVSITIMMPVRHRRGLMKLILAAKLKLKTAIFESFVMVKHRFAAFAHDLYACNHECELNGMSDRTKVLALCASSWRNPPPLPI